MRRFITLAAALPMLLMGGSGGIAFAQTQSDPGFDLPGFATSGRGVQGPAHLQPRQWEMESLPPLPAELPVDAPTVAAIQRSLQQRGFYQGAIDGTAGAQTRSAISAYQSSNSMPVTGEISPALLGTLNITMPGLPALALTEEPVPVATLWTPQALVGKNVCSPPGDLLGRVVDIVLNSDGSVAGIVADISNLYGNDSGTTFLPWKMVAGSVPTATVVVPLTAEQAIELRRHPPAFQLEPGQRLASSLEKAPVTFNGKPYGKVRDVAFDGGGRLDLVFMAKSSDGLIYQVPAERVDMEPGRAALALEAEPPADAAMPQAAALPPESE